jgi:hypothetical protein
MTESAFGIEHGEFSKALPRIPGGTVGNLGRAVGGAARSLGGALGSTAKPAMAGAFKPIKPMASQAFGAMKANKPLVGGVGAAGLGAGFMAGRNSNNNQKLRQFR